MGEIGLRPSSCPPPEAAKEEKRPYAAPRLTKLGSVRTLSLGSMAGFVEGAGTFRMM